MRVDKITEIGNIPCTQTWLCMVVIMDGWEHPLKNSMHIIFNCIFALIILTLSTCLIHEKNIYETISIIWIIFLLDLIFLIIFVTCYKIKLFFGELFDINKVYKGNILSTFKATIYFNPASCIVIIIVFFSLLILIFNTRLNIIKLIQSNGISVLLIMGPSLLLLNAVSITDCRAEIVSNILSGHGPGTSMACNYFYGYLKIVLPSSGGNERTGILHTIETFEANNGVKIPVKKLFILIPSSSYIPPDLKDASENWLNYARTLETITLDRAGVKYRTYHNTVYELRTEGPAKLPKQYVVVEGATPLYTFLEVQDRSHQYSSFYKEFNNEIIRDFYTTLKQLINDNPDCKDYCELVYYEDVVNGKKVNPAHVLLERIKILSDSENQG